jgi:hypothetical protein
VGILLERDPYKGAADKKGVRRELPAAISKDR